MFTKILIANRGEIACRIMRTANSIGISTVAVYSDADANAMHVAMADEAIHIGGSPVAESYLRGDVIIEAALSSGAQAIHPGYGFLSENPEFVEQVTAAGLRFIGPSADAIRAMGLKDAAKNLMQDAGVPVVPGYHGGNQDADFLKAEADRIGYPVLIKARAGGGGKGMRKVDTPADFAASLEGAMREGMASFGDSSCLIEKFISTPRHIEIQVFGDDHGNVVHLFERDCSLQRRHQKVIEEAPAPGMTAEMRQAMGDAAVTACKAINYSGAGTIEFIVDSTDGLKPDGFWFMEMNTRLQVEHPVTEAITGQDLVAWQLKVAAGEKLPLSQDQLSINGWAFESRVYAEDVESGFLPATGTMDYLRFPSNVRIDTGIREGDSITPFYDPMIAKLIVHAETRAESLSKMHRALQETKAAGSTTNVNFLAALCVNNDFRTGDVDTGLIERDLDQLVAAQSVPTQIVAVAAISALKLIDNSADHIGFTLWEPLSQSVTLLLTNSAENSDDDLQRVQIQSLGDRTFSVIVGDAAHQIVVLDVAGKLNIDGMLTTAASISMGNKVSVFADKSYHFTLPDPLVGSVDQGAGEDRIIAPMPGQVKVINAAAGDHVTAGDALIVMEAMKMEHTLTAPRDGEVAEVVVTVGDQVEASALLLQLSEEIS